MEMLASMRKEAADDRLTIWNYADAPVGEALELVGRVLEACEGMQLMLDHVFTEHDPQASTSGETPLMRP